jgi:23S rRNA (cytidine1920-2'-O)/16S rRNA (cytidine1409-2'-O)-methyltransferase
MPPAGKTKEDKERVDKLLVERGLAISRTKAQALVMAGVVLVDERRIEKASELVPASSSVRIKGESPESRYVSRGGLKLEHALNEFGIDVSGYRCLDVGSSTGGFTDCLLQHGAAAVVAVDSGTNQMVWQLRNDPRVHLREKTNARNLKPGDLPHPFDIAVIDVSFISLTKILPSVVPLLKLHGKVIALIKPQFEVGRGEVGKGGIVRDPEQHKRVIDQIDRFSRSIGLLPNGVVKSPILGAEGNTEFLALYDRE